MVLLSIHIFTTYTKCHMHTEPQTKDSSLNFSLHCSNVTMSRNQTSSSSVLNNYIFTVHQLPSNQSYTISFCWRWFLFICLLCFVSVDLAVSVHLTYLTCTERWNSLRLHYLYVVSKWKINLQIKKVLRFFVSYNRKRWETSNPSIKMMENKQMNICA